MSHYSDIMTTVISVGTLLTGGGLVAGRKILAKLDRVGDAYEQVAGKPAVLDRSGSIAEAARPGLPAQIAVVRQLAERAIGGNDEILHRQDLSDRKLDGHDKRLGQVEAAVKQTLKAVTQ